MRLASLFRSQKATFFVAKITKDDLAVLGELMDSGTVTPIVDRRYALSEVADALAYLGEGHARGKVVLTV
jgi:NADPH:quinone reductase-like Zn-dependent oxidoreductase